MITTSIVFFKVLTMKHHRVQALAPINASAALRPDCKITNKGTFNILNVYTCMHSRAADETAVRQANQVRLFDLIVASHGSAMLWTEVCCLKGASNDQGEPAPWNQLIPCMFKRTLNIRNTHAYLRFRKSIHTRDMQYHEMLDICGPNRNTRINLVHAN